jgi:RNA polymerase sigma factor (sigma-70 family)
MRADRSAPQSGGDAPEGPSSKPELRAAPSREERLTPEQQAIVLSVRWLVEREVAKLTRGRADRELVRDLRSYGMLAAVNAARHFDASLGPAFESYALPWIRGTVCDRLESEHRHGRRLRAALSAGRVYLAEASDRGDVAWDDEDELRTKLDAVAERLVGAMVVGYCVGRSEGPEEDFAERECRERAMAVVRGALDRLDTEGKRLFMLRYVKGLTHQEMAEALGVARKTVHRHLEALLDGMRQELLLAGIESAPIGRDFG